jgi:cell division transport system ATP-binding protein
LSIVEFENVSLSFGQNLKILSGVSFSLDSGSLNFVTGSSGSGKSALLQLMSGGCGSWMGKIKMFKNEILPANKDQFAEMRSEIGVVFQELRLLDHLSPRENLSLPLYIDGISGDELATPVSELLEWLGPRIGGAKIVASLSGGEKRLLAIARSLVRKPRLVLADEPTASLDLRQKVAVLRFFTKLCNLGTAVVIATNDDWLISQYAYSSQLYLERGLLQQIEGAGLSSTALQNVSEET